MNTPYQRKGAKSNAHVGKDFETEAQKFFARKGLSLQRNTEVPIGISGKKVHNFDLGDPVAKVVVECKSHKWTEGDNVPSAKMIAWNEAMFLFYATPKSYRKIFFVLKDYRSKRNETLAQYYIRTNPHLIPDDVEIWEFDEEKRTGVKLK